jgi:hypothetical protein
MKEEKSLKEKIALLEKELATVTDELDKTRAGLKDLEDIKLELKGLKLFMGRVHPEFKAQFLEVMRKIKC